MSKDEQNIQSEEVQMPKTPDEPSVQEAALHQEQQIESLGATVTEVSEVAADSSSATINDESVSSASAVINEEPASSASAEAAEPQRPPHFEPIPPEKLKRAKRIRRILWAIIILLILVLLAAGAGAVYYYLNYGEPTAHVETNPVEIETVEDVNDRGTTEAIDMPNLKNMFGKTPEEVVALLGSDYVITKTEVSTDGGEAEGEAEGEGSEAEANDEPATQIAAMATISYTPEDSSSSMASSQVQNIYLSLNESGMTVELYFVSSMSLLDYPISSFDALVATKESFVDSLTSAGITVASEVEYTVPDSKDYTEYVDPEASELLIKKQSVSFAGPLASEQAPTKFEITYTYDYGATGVKDSPDKQPSQRMLYIKLS